MSSGRFVPVSTAGKPPRDVRPLCRARRLATIAHKRRRVQRRRILLVAATICAAYQNILHRGKVSTVSS